MANYNSFKEDWTRPGHNSIDYDHVFACQCVDLILEFMYECAHVGTGIRGNAIDYANSPTQAFLDATIKVTDGSKQAGDILVFKGLPKNTDGHIALRDNDLDKMLEQNALGSGSGTGRDAIGVYRTIPYDRLVATYRLKAFLPAPVAPVTPAYKYERLDAEMNVRIKPDMNVWDLNSFAGGYSGAVSLGVCSTDPNAPTDFKAVGKATKLDMPEHPVYFMSNDSFGDADKTGVPAHNQGVNTVDLIPVPAGPAIEASTPVIEKTEEVFTPVNTAGQDLGESIPVKVNAPNPEAWKLSYKTNRSGEYKALVDCVVHDLDGKLPDAQLLAGQVKKIAGDFVGPDKVDYWRTTYSVATKDSHLNPKAEDWRGIPKEIDGKPTLEEDETVFGYIADGIDDIRESLSKRTQKRLASVSSRKQKTNWLAGRMKRRI